ncbi:hypothetical protein KAW96_01555 [candidate division WOR-3 bacterium]|nr:hypothetical protein [candidate division WOR-3 bacterium]
MPKIEVRLSKNYCLYDFLSRLSPYGPFEKERQLYSKKLRKISIEFFEFVRENKGKSYRFFIKNVIRYDNAPFRRLWKEYQSILEKQYIQIKKIIKQEGKVYLKRILDITKAKSYQYERIIIFLTFPAIDKIKPKKYKHGGYPSIYGETCVITFCLRPDFKYNNADDLFVLWHEIIHTLDLPIDIWRDIDEGITQLYGDIVSHKSKKIIKDRLSSVFQKYPRKIATILVRVCVNWNWKRKDIFQLKFELAKQCRKFPRRI